MFHDESCKPTYFGVIKSKVKVMSHKDITIYQRESLHSCECWLLLVSTYFTTVASQFTTFYKLFTYESSINVPFLGETG